MNGGKVIVCGKPADVLSEELLADVYGVRVHRVSRHPSARPAFLVEIDEDTAMPDTSPSVQGQDRSVHP